MSVHAVREPVPTGSGRSEEEARWGELMGRAQQGDAEAYHQLLSELDRVLRVYLRRLVGDTPLLDDAVQETLLAVHKARHTYDPRRPFRPWLLSIARYKAIDLLRRGRNPAAAAASDSTEESRGGHTSGGPEAALEVARLLAALPESFREAIVLTRIQGHTVQEAAAAAGVSPAAMRSRVHRGMWKLRRLLAEEPL